MGADAGHRQQVHRLAVCADRRGVIRAGSRLPQARRALSVKPYGRCAQACGGSRHGRQSTDDACATQRQPRFDHFSIYSAAVRADSMKGICPRDGDLTRVALGHRTAWKLLTTAEEGSYVEPWSEGADP